MKNQATMLISEIRWSRDIAKAPRGERITVGAAKVRGGAERSITQFNPKWILACVVDKGVRKTMQTYRSEPNSVSPTGRWVGLATDQEIYAWAPWPEPIDLGREMA